MILNNEKQDINLNGGDDTGAQKKNEKKEDENEWPTQDLID